MRHSHNLFVAALWFSSVACGQHEVAPPVGILVDRLGVTVQSLGSSPQDIATENSLSPTDDRRVVHADVVGDGTLETLVEIPPGNQAAKGGVEVLDAKGGVVAKIATNEYLTDFGAVRADVLDKWNPVVYTYPTKDGGGRFSVIHLPDMETVATWEEHPAPSRFTAGSWHGATALFYIKGTAVIVRSTTGQLLTTLNASGIDAFSRIHVGETNKQQTVVLASGSGYTPYHMVAIFNDAGELVYERTAEEHAFKLETASNEPRFDVWSRSTHWRYTIQQNVARHE